MIRSPVTLNKFNHPRIVKRSYTAAATVTGNKIILDAATGAASKIDERLFRIVETVRIIRKVSLCHSQPSGNTFPIS